MRNFLRQVLTLFALVVSTAALAQNGRIIGKVFDAKTKEPIPFAGVKISSGGAERGGAQTDINGEFRSAPLTPGNYDVKVVSTGYQPQVISGVSVSVDATTRIDIKMSEVGIEKEKIVVTAYKKPLVDNPAGGIRNNITAKELERKPTRSIAAIIAQGANVVSSDVGGDLNVRGARSGDNAYYVNGIRVPNGSLPPVEAIEEISTIVGGVPAQYGDALGGVVTITTKSAPSKFRGSLQLETSAPFDKYGYNLLAGSLSGPLYKVVDKTDSSEEAKNGNPRKRSLFGFYTNFQYSDVADGSPSALGYWRATDATINSLRANPVRSNQAGTGYISNANFLTQDAFQKVSANPNTYRSSIQGNANIDFQPSKNILLTAGGNINWSRARFNGEDNLFNYPSAPVGYNYTWNAFLRFRQTFAQDAKGSFKNFFYQLQADINRTGSWSEDVVHGTNQSRYNYVGAFRDSLGDVTLLPGGNRTFPRYDPSTGRVDSNFTLASNSNTTVVLKNQQLGLIFNGSDINRDLSNYNTFIFGQRPLFLQNATTADITNGFLLSRGVGINGSGALPYGYSYPGNTAVGGFMSPVGQNQAGFGKNISDQLALTLQAGADLGNHTFRVGLEFQQRFIASYGGPGQGIWNRARILSNRQFDGNTIIDTVSRINPNDPSRRLLEVFFTDHVNRNGNTDRAVGQTDFDYNLRRSLGMNTLGNNRINIDELNPDQLNLKLFSVSNILDQAGAPISNWIGYDPYGNSTGELFNTKTDWNSFFTDTVNRPIVAFRPTYIAGYIEDKYEIQNLTVRLGVRFERYDVNQPVLKDKYSFTNLLQVKDVNFSKFGGNYTKPANIGDDYAIYVDNDASGYDGTEASQQGYRVRGFRSGDRFFTASGIETNNFNDVSVSGQLNPWYNISNLANDPILGPLARERKVTLDAFSPYQAKWLALPRISLTFPINENSNFYAYYDQLAQRPLNQGGGFNNTTALNYYAAALQGNGVNPTFGNAGQYISNPNLQPQTKIDYAAGFQQKLASNMALKFNAYYTEVKDLIQIVRINGGYPNSYLTDGNQDFSVMRGTSIEFDYRNPDDEKSGLEFDASYTLQFAETSASNFAAAQLQNTSNPNLRTTVPSGVDPRHAFKLNIDYRIVKGDGPTIAGFKPFQNMGINMQWVALSGNPYTRFVPNYFTNQVTGSINGSRLPWNFRADFRIEKFFEFKGSSERAIKHRINTYIYITNLFDIRNVIGVFPKSGTETDDGYLNSDLARQQAEIQQGAGLSAAAYNNYYNMLVLSPGLVTLPRWVRVGVNYSF